MESELRKKHHRNTRDGRLVAQLAATHFTWNAQFSNQICPSNYQQLSNWIELIDSTNDMCVTNQQLLVSSSNDRNRGIVHFDSISPTSELLYLLRSATKCLLFNIARHNRVSPVSNSMLSLFRSIVSAFVLFCGVEPHSVHDTHYTSLAWKHMSPAACRSHFIWLVILAASCWHRDNVPHNLIENANLERTNTKMRQRLKALNEFGVALINHIFVCEYIGACYCVVSGIDVLWPISTRCVVQRFGQLTKIILFGWVSEENFRILISRCKRRQNATRTHTRLIAKNRGKKPQNDIKLTRSSWYLIWARSSQRCVIAEMMILLFLLS